MTIQHSRLHNISKPRVDWWLVVANVMHERVYSLLGVY
jgi:hypothetical protein